MLSLRKDLSVFYSGGYGCPFPYPYISHKYFKKCGSFQSSTEDLLVQQIGKRKDNSLIIITNYLNSYFNQDGVNSDRFLDKHGNSIENNTTKIDLFIKSIENFSKRISIANPTATIALVMPIPEHPNFDANRCSPQWFNTLSMVNCTSNKDYQVKTRSQIVSSLTTRLNHIENIFLFDPIDIFCDTSKCKIVENDGSTLYIDDDHISPQSSIILVNRLLLVLAGKHSNILQKQG